MNSYIQFCILCFQRSLWITAGLCALFLFGFFSMTLQLDPRELKTLEETPLTLEMFKILSKAYMGVLGFVIVYQTVLATLKLRREKQLPRFPG